MKKNHRQTATEIVVPASSSNLGSGFDVLSLAVALYLRVRVEPSTHTSHLLLLSGVGGQEIAQEKSNLILKVAQHVAAAERVVIPPLRLTIHNEIPLGRGLGSSAAAIIAGISVAEIFLRTPLSAEKLFLYGLRFESHPDNLAACFHGSLTAARLDSKGSAVFQALAIDKRLKLVVAIPDFRTSTREARRVLPSRYPRADVIANLQNAVLLSHALAHVGDEPSRLFFEDRLHQPYRRRLVPGLAEALALPDLSGLFGVFLSGAGSSLAALATRNFSSIGRALQSCFSKHGLSSTIQILSIDRIGRRVKHLS